MHSLLALCVCVWSSLCVCVYVRMHACAYVQAILCACVFAILCMKMFVNFHMFCTLVYLCIVCFSLSSIIKHCFWKRSISSLLLLLLMHCLSCSMIVFDTIELQVYGLRLVAGEFVTGLIKIGHQRGILICCHRTFEFDSGTHNYSKENSVSVYYTSAVLCKFNFKTLRICYSPISPDAMDWSPYYPAHFSTDGKAEERKCVEFADIGCGYGGLLGNVWYNNHIVLC